MVPPIEARFLGVKLNQYNKPVFVPNFNTLFNQFIKQNYNTAPNYIPLSAIDSELLIEYYYTGGDDLFDYL